MEKDHRKFDPYLWKIWTLNKNADNKDDSFLHYIVFSP